MDKRETKDGSDSRALTVGHNDASTGLKVFNLLDKSGYSKYITYDPEIESNFKYYTGILFKVYTYGVGDSICKGGRYNSLLEKYGEG